MIAVKPSHNANCELARLINAQMRRPLEIARAFAPPPPPTRNGPSKEAGVGESTVQDGGTLDITQVMKLLPHRYPFLMVDKVTKIAGNRITAVKNISVNEPYFQGHFPNHPMPAECCELRAIAPGRGPGDDSSEVENLGKLALFHGG